MSEMRHHARILDTIMATHWAMGEEHLRLLLSVANREPDVAAIERELGHPLENTYAVSERDGVARIPVAGPLFRYANLFCRVSGATSYELLSQDVAAVMQRTDIRAVVLEIDSPGGEVNGCAELAQLIAGYRGTKPITAYVSNLAGSAAYWIASACDRIVASETAVLGSIGVCFAYVDERVRDAAMGRQEIRIVSSQSPRKNRDPATDEGRSDAQALADSLADRFIARVAEYRGTTVQHVLQDFGQGGLLVGSDAVAAGLADAVGTLESVQAELLTGGARPAARPVFGGRAMSDTPKATLDLPVATALFEVGATVSAAVAKTVTVEAGATGEVVEVAEGRMYAVRFAAGEFRWMGEVELAASTTTDDTTPTDAPAEPEAVAEPPATPIDPATAERQRILGIAALSKPGLEELTSRAQADPAVSITAFAELVAIAERAKGKAHLASLKADEDQLKAPDGAPASGAERDGPQAESRRILALYETHIPRRAAAQRT